MKKILFGLAALSATAFGADSTGVHNSIYGNNQIDVETRAFIINSGLVITASNSTGTVTDAIKKAVLDHGTLMAGTSATSEVARTVYVRKTNGGDFPENTVINIALTADVINGNDLKNTDSRVTENNTIAHTLDALVNKGGNEITYQPGSGNTTNGNQTLSLSGSEDKNKVSAGDFKVETATHNIPIELKSTIATNITSSNAEGQYTNTSTLAVRFSKIPGENGSYQGTPAADYGNPGTVDSNSSANQTPGILADGTPLVMPLTRR